MFELHLSIHFRLFQSIHIYIYLTLFFPVFALGKGKSIHIFSVFFVSQTRSFSRASKPQANLLVNQFPHNTKDIDFRLFNWRHQNTFYWGVLDECVSACVSVGVCCCCWCCWYRCLCLLVLRQVAVCEHPTEQVRLIEIRYHHRRTSDWVNKYNFSIFLIHFFECYFLSCFVILLICPFCNMIMSVAICIWYRIVFCICVT